MSTNIRVSNQNNILKPVGQVIVKAASNPVEQTVVSGAFYRAKPITIKEMIIRRINKTLCIILLCTIGVTFVSYYIAMNFEAKLNALDREIVQINTENQDLQADLDRYKSFNNVDSKIGEFKLLQKAEKVMEVTADSSPLAVPHSKKAPQTKFSWAIGY
ncbi:hypothetical protein J6N69_04810 [bacterium]|nr:hypothetical protein [bacterium]